MRTIIILAAVALLYFILRWQYRKNPAGFTKRFLYWGVIALLGGLLLLVATGRLHWLSALLAGLVAIAGRLISLMRYLPIINSIKSALGLNAAGADGFSRLQSRYFKMELNQQSGEIDGVVLEGEFQGRRLSELTRDALFRLLLECREQDRESAMLLAAYLARYYRSDQRFREESFAGQQGPVGSETMTRGQALDILGLTEPVEEKEVIQAHRRLIQKFHPDRGGSNYLAAKINAAKDFLLERGKG